ncbi:MAG: hypothetical protein HKM00_00995 [Gallionella sp.]|nr:hypothetical protein [Gallionella sp.]
MAWLKRGLVFNPGLHAPWIHTHAQVPTAFEMDGCIRVYFAGRNQGGKSFISYVDLDKTDPTKVMDVHDRALIALGKVGSFDDEGMMPSDLVEYQGRIYLYYSGWNQRVTSAYHNTTGLIFSDDGGVTFHRSFEGPILDRIPTEPYMAVTPTVLIEDGLWQMWYVSGTSWELIAGKYEPVYVIKYAHSADGIFWVRPEGVCIKPNHNLEAYSRPCVVKDGSLYKMWYCFRDSIDFRGGCGSYRLGYAESADGIDWHRMDDSMILQGAAGDWESDMQCYPYVIDVNGSRYMFYNGNGFGRSGFGVAEWVE